MLVVAALILIALFFDYINGFHDAANSIATVVSTRVLSPGKAVVWAAFFNFVAAFTFGTAVARTVGAGMIDIHVVTFAVIFGGLCGAIVWDLITWLYGLPTSSSHALIGGYAGAAVAKAGWSAVLPAGWTKTLIFVVLSPLIGMGLGLALMTSIMWLFRWMPPARVDRWFRRAQLVSAAFFSLNHGANDAQKTMGIIAGVLFTTGYIPPVRDPVLGRAHRPHRHRSWNARRRLAHHSYDGLENHQAHSRRRVRRRDRCGAVDSDCDAGGRAGQHHARDHRLDCRRWGDTAALRRALGRGHANRVGVDPDDSRRLPDCRGRLHAAASRRRAVRKSTAKTAKEPRERSATGRRPTAGG